MPRVDKTAFVDFASTGCEKQLRIDLHPTSKKYRHERTQLGIPRPQIRPVLQDMTATGNEWGEAKVKELSDAFGSQNLLGGTRTILGSAPTKRLHFKKSDLSAHLGSATAGQFLIESSFAVTTPTFLREHQLEEVDFEGTPSPLDFRAARPDVIEVLAPQPESDILLRSGRIVASGADDTRLLLRVIDVKLTSEPGPRYFSELAFYSLALAAWLDDHGFDDRFAVSAHAAVWPGSETTTAFADLISTGTVEGRYEAFHEVLELAPLRIFVGEVLRLLRVVIPRLLSTPLEEIPWAVTPACQGCQNLGQLFLDEPGDSPADWDPQHCLPIARREQHLSRLPYLSRGSLRVLREQGHSDVEAVADLTSDNSAFDAHHRLRGQRTVVTTRARALRGDDVDALDLSSATTAAIPKSAKLRIYVTADFDPGSALTLAFGLTYGWVSASEQLKFPKFRMHYATARTAAAEWSAVAALLAEIEMLLGQATAVDPDATVQVYVWDQLTLKHLTRVFSRHLPAILGSSMSRLAWLFPPEEVVDNASIVATPAVSVVKDAVRSLLSLNLAHNYNLLDTARRFHGEDTAFTEFNVPRYWSDPFSDQIPPERAHQIWQGRHLPGRPTQAQLTEALQRTVRTKLRALDTVTGQLTTSLKGRLPRSAPKISALRAPEDLSTSHFGALLYAFTRLEGALSSIDTAQTRALPLEEREAKGATARLVRRLPRTEERALLTPMQLGTSCWAYELAPTSTEFKGKSGFMWTMLPADEMHWAGASVGSFLYAKGQGALVRSLGSDVWSKTMGEVFGVTLHHIDRSALRIVVEYDDFRPRPQLRSAILRAGLIDLSADLAIDSMSRDFLSAPLSKALKAIGNPPSSSVDPRVQLALGSTRTPRTTSSHPAEHFIWAPTTMSTAPSGRSSVALRPLLGAHHQLNATQEVAWAEAMDKRLTLIWGPPGTGKTNTVRAIIAGLVAEGLDRPLRIGITAANHTAMDNVIMPLADELDALSPAVDLYRVRSSSSAPVEWLRSDRSVTTDAERAVLYRRLRQPKTTVVAGLPMQLHKLSELDRRQRGSGLYDVLIIDEAGAIDVAQAVLALQSLRKDASVIVAGDPLQLPPIHKGTPPLGLESHVGSIYDFFSGGFGVTAQELHNNYRSNAAIVELARRAGYPAALTAVNPDRRISYREGVDISESTEWPVPLQLSPEVVKLADPDLPVVCVTYDEGVSGQWNQFEVEQVAALLVWYRHSLASGVDGQNAEMTDEYFWTKAVGVVTPHRAQRARIVESLLAAFAVPGHDPRLTSWVQDAVDTVERFQGQERDVIVASYAVGDPDTIDEEAEFLMNLNRFNVLATRAKAKLVVFVSRELVSYLGGDLEILRSSGLLKDFVGVYCDQSRPATLSWNDSGSSRDVEVEVRWPTV